MARPARTRPVRSQTRDKVLEAALVEFHEKGIQSTSIERIARRAGMTRGAVYSSFTSKQDIVLTLVERSFGELLESGLRAVAECPDADTAIDLLADDLLRSIAGDPGRQRFVAELFVITRDDPVLAQAIRARREALYRGAARDLAPAMARLGVVSRYSYEEILTGLVTLSIGLATEYAIGPYPPSGALLRGLLSDLFTGGTTPGGDQAR